jgi:hypothetical protein
LGPGTCAGEASPAAVARGLTACGGIDTFNAIKRRFRL